MLEYSFFHPDRLSEALKTKFIRRLSGFFRCTNDEKAFFASLDWDVDNLVYVESGCSLYNILVEDIHGISFLTSDRRGLLFSEISNEIGELIDNVNKIPANQNYLFSSKNIFRQQNCKYKMIREYFILLGRLSNITGGRKIMEDNQVFQHMSSMANCRSLNYISRLILTSFAFTDKGFVSKSFMQLWGTNDKNDHDLKDFVYNLLFAILVSRPQDFVDWGLDLLVAYIRNEDANNPILAKIITIVSYNKSLLNQVISTRLFDELLPIKSVLLKYSSSIYGISLLNEKKYLSKEIEHWISTGCREYVGQVESLVSKSFNHQCDYRNIIPIPVNASKFSAYSFLQKSLKPTPAIDDKNASTFNSTTKGVSVLKKSNSSGNAGINRQSTTSKINENVTLSRQISIEEKITDYNALAVDLEGLVRAPFNIEVKLSNSQISPISNSSDYLKVDSYVDISDLQHITTAGIISDKNRIIKIRGIVVDAKNIPNPFAVTSNRVISSTLLIGVHPVHKNGNVYCITEKLISKNKTLTQISSLPNVPGRDSLQRRGSITATNDSDQDLPISFLHEDLFDWSHCKPIHRQSGLSIDLGDDLYAIELPEEPVVLIFARKSNHLSSSRHATDSGNRLEKFFHLIEIQYFIRLQTGQSTFVSMPCHLFGELSRTIEGCVILNNLQIISTHMSTARREENDHVDRAAALWSLGHICSNDTGFSAVIRVDSSFVEWCVHSVINAANLCIRG